MQSLKVKSEKSGLVARLFALIASLGINALGKLFSFQANLNARRMNYARMGPRSAQGVIGQVLVVVVLIIVGGVAAILIYAFQNTGSSVGNLSTAQKGNVSSIINGGASTLQFIPLIALSIFIAIILAVLLGIFVQRRQQ